MAEHNMSVEVFEVTEDGYIPEEYGILVKPYNNNGEVAIGVYYRGLEDDVVLEVLANLGQSVRRYLDKSDKVQVTHEARPSLGQVPTEVEVSTDDEDAAVAEAKAYLEREFGIKF